MLKEDVIYLFGSAIMAKECREQLIDICLTLSPPHKMGMTGHCGASVDTWESSLEAQNFPPSQTIT